MYRIVVNDDSIERVLGIVFTVWRRFYISLWDEIQRRSLLEDLRQEAVVIAYEAYEAGGGMKIPEEGEVPREQFKKIVREINKGWYSFLKKYGFRKTEEGWKAEVNLEEEEEKEKFIDDDIDDDDDVCD